MYIFVTSTSANFRVQDLGTKPHFCMVRYKCKCPVCRIGQEGETTAINAVSEVMFCNEICLDHWQSVEDFVKITLQCSLCVMAMKMIWYPSFPQMFWLQAIPSNLFKFQMKICFSPQTPPCTGHLVGICPCDQVLKLNIIINCYMLTIVLPTEDNDQFIVSDWESCLTTENQGQLVKKYSTH